jgi:hypothetical protein
MSTHNPPEQADIDRVVELMEETGVDLTDLFLEIFVTWEDAAVLALLPANVIQAALVYLRQQKHDLDEAAAHDEDIDVTIDDTTEETDR